MRTSIWCDQAPPGLEPAVIPVTGTAVHDLDIEAVCLFHFPRNQQLQPAVTLVVHANQVFFQVRHGGPVETQLGSQHGPVHGVDPYATLRQHVATEPVADHTWRGSLAKPDDGAL